MLNDDEEQTRHRVGERASGMRTLASAKALWQKTSGPKPCGGEMGVDRVSERRKKGI